MFFLGQLAACANEHRDALASRLGMFLLRQTERLSFGFFDPISCEVEPLRQKLRLKVSVLER